MDKPQLISDIEDVKDLMNNEEYDKAIDDLSSIITYIEMDMYSKDELFKGDFEGMFGQMLLDKLTLLLETEGCKSILDALEDKFGV